MEGPTSHFYFSQRLRLHYVDWGNAGAPPLILLHGGRDHCRNWDWVAQRLRKDWHIIAPDLRGHGDSEWSKSANYGTAGYVYDLAQLIHQLKLAPVTIVAHSLGGSITTRYAGVYPETVKIAIAGTGYVGLSNAVILAQHNEVWALDLLPEKVELINARRSPIEDPELEDYLATRPLDLTATLDKTEAFTGRVVDTTDEGVIVDVEGEHREIAFAELGAGKVEIEFNRGGADS